MLAKSSVRSTLAPVGLASCIQTALSRRSESQAHTTHTFMASTTMVKWLVLSIMGTVLNQDSFTTRGHSQLLTFQVQSGRKHSVSMTAVRSLASPHPSPFLPHLYPNQPR